MKFTRSITSGGVALIAAATLAVGAASGATAAHLIGSKDIRDHSVQKVDLSKGVNAALAKAGTPGPAGPAGADGNDSTVPGPKGDPGTPGAPGRDGVSGIEYRTFDYIAGKESTDSEPGMGSDYTGAGAGGIATVVCSSPSKVALAGGVQFLGLDADNGQAAVTGGNGIVDSFPGRMDWSTNTPRPGVMSGWVVRLNKYAAGEPLRLWVVCANAA